MQSSYGPFASERSMLENLIVKVRYANSYPTSCFLAEEIAQFSAYDGLYEADALRSWLHNASWQFMLTFREHLFMYSDVDFVRAYMHAESLVEFFDVHERMKADFERGIRVANDARRSEAMLAIFHFFHTYPSGDPEDNSNIQIVDEQVRLAEEERLRARLRIVCAEEREARIDGLVAHFHGSVDREDAERMIAPLYEP